jgi:predicted component of type VI protein secretion system
MKLSLVVQTPGPNLGKVLEIKLAQFVVGRDPQCHLRPASPMISKRHCAVLQREDKVFVRDFDSTNGTFVNDEQVKGQVELHDGDRLKMGPLLFEVKLEAATPATASKQDTAKANASASGAVKAPAKQATARKPAAATVDAVKTDTQTDAPAAQDTQTDVPAAENGSSSETETAEGDSSSDEDIAAMLLSLHDDGGSGLSGGLTEVPEGSTVHEMPLPPEVAAEMAKEKEKAKQASPGNTSQAAKSILEKYMKRPRNQ